MAHAREVWLEPSEWGIVGGGKKSQGSYHYIAIKE